MAGSSVDLLLTKVLGEDEVEATISAIQLTEAGEQAILPVIRALAPTRSGQQVRLRSVARGLATRHAFEFARLLGTTTDARVAERLTGVTRGIPQFVNSLLRHVRAAPTLRARAYLLRVLQETPSDEALEYILEELRQADRPLVRHAIMGSASQSEYGKIVEALQKAVANDEQLHALALVCLMFHHSESKGLKKVLQGWSSAPQLGTLDSPINPKGQGDLAEDGRPRGVAGSDREEFEHMVGAQIAGLWSLRGMSIKQFVDLLFTHGYYRGLMRKYAFCDDVDASIDPLPGVSWMVPFSLDILEDPYEYVIVRTMAAWQLIYSGYSASADKILAFLQSPEYRADPTEGIIEDLGMLDHPEVRSYLADLILEPARRPVPDPQQGEWRAEALRALIWTNPPTAVSILSKAVDDRELRNASLDLLAENRSPEAHKILTCGIRSRLRSMIQTGCCGSVGCSIRPVCITVPWRPLGGGEGSSQVFSWVKAPTSALPRLSNSRLNTAWRR